MVKKLFITLLFLSGILLLVLWNDSLSGSKIQSELSAIKSILAVEEKSEPITVAFVGDIMLDRGVKSSVVKNFGGDYGALFANVPELRSADIAFANLEGPVSDTGKNVGSKYSFRMDPNVLPMLREAGFDVFSFANNHVGDWSKSAFDQTLELLRAQGILFAGAGKNYQEAITPQIITVHDTKIGFLAFSDVGPNWMAATSEQSGILLATDKQLPEIISAAKAQTDYLFVSFHWGVEYDPATTRQKTLARQTIDAGADGVIGHHPHVIQANETYNGKPIFYSLGNFIFDQYFSPETMRGMLALVTISPEGEISSELFTTTLSKQYQPGPFAPYKTSDAVLTKKAVPFSCPKPKTTSPNYWMISLPNKEITLKDHTPNNLVKVSNSVTGENNICITKETYAAYEEMRKDMEEDGVSAHVLSGYRDAKTQAENVAERKELAAPVGQSEHHLGTAIDFTSGTKPVKFEESPEYPWMVENAWKYGFVQSYQADKEGKTGFKGEAWHWRYVGEDIARKLRRSTKPLNDYLEDLAD